MPGVGAAVSPEQLRQSLVVGDCLLRAMPRALRMVGPRVGQAAVWPERRLHPVVDHVIPPAGVYDGRVGRVAVRVEHRWRGLDDGSEVLPGLPAVLGAKKQHPAVARAVSGLVVADVYVPVRALGVQEQETVHRPLVVGRAAQDRISREPLEGVERGVAIDRVAQPGVDMRGIREVGLRRPVIVPPTGRELRRGKTATQAEAQAERH